MGGNVLRNSLGSETNRPIVDPGTMIRGASGIQCPTPYDPRLLVRIGDVGRAWQLAQLKYVQYLIDNASKANFKIVPNPADGLPQSKPFGPPPVP